MEEEKTVVEWKKWIEPVLQSKVEEFHMMGYEKARKEEIWNCLIHKVWKGKPNKRLYEIVQDIFHLSVGTYMAYLTVQAYQNDDLLASIEALRYNYPENESEEKAEMYD
ncbi:hypothetical protein GLW05_06990 [Pontibacillus yanchengensis]|uniref:Post-transcriptional regulator n=1 Tax=Pontibacillus yanchengensis TaxID=462910 RepID=A0A6I4ZT02_9BACI|nr:post-transcriptional regulator [Pontibacillus yanchengensis]MYL33345.1 hypothetical protein [Pontibacillus yanchengensis]